MSSTAATSRWTTSERSDHIRCDISPKCSSEQSRAHSPQIMAARCSNNGSLTDNEGEGEGAEEATFEREASGSTYSSSSGRDTPPYLRWAKNLEEVLDDFTGMELFRRFLGDEYETLRFWYACKGLSMTANQSDPEKLAMSNNVAVHLINLYLLPGAPHYLRCINDSTRMELIRRHGARDIRIDMFNIAQNEVLAYLRTRHQEFIRSDMYIEYLQAMQQEGGGDDSPKCYTEETHSNNSFSGDEATPGSRVLPTVREDIEYDGELESELLPAPEESFDTPKSHHQSEINNASCSRTAGVGAPADDVSQRHYRPSSSSRQRYQISYTAASNEMSLLSNFEPCNPNPWMSFVERDRRKSPSQATIGQQRVYSSGLTKKALDDSARMRYTFTGVPASVGIPPNPYYTTNTYLGYYPTSAKDSELQSMSSGTTTESGFVGASQHRSERALARQHAERNREVNPRQNVIPRTQVSSPPATQNMMDEVFRRQLITKLERLRRSRESDEDLKASLKRLSQPQTGTNDHRATVKDCYRKLYNNQQDDDSEAILQDFFTNHEFLKDSPKRSPLLSPGCAYANRRHSPAARSPNRAMIASFPHGGQPMGPFPTKRRETSSLVPQTMVSHVRGKAGHHSAENTLSRVKHDVTAPVSLAHPDRRSGAIPKRYILQAQACRASDTSGISSSTSTEPSLVSAKQTPNFAFNRSSERPTYDKDSDSANDFRPKNRSGVCHTMAAPGSKSHSSSCRREADKLGSDRSRSQKLIGDSHSMHSNKTQPRRSDAVSHSGDSGATNGASDFLYVFYLFPEQETYYKTAFPGTSITLKEFKALVSNKKKPLQNVKCSFNCGDSEMQLITDDCAVLPCIDNTVRGKIEFT